MKIITLIIIIILFNQISFSQNHKNIYLEVGGNGIFGSLNFENNIAKSKYFSYRLGATQDFYDIELWPIFISTIGFTKPILKSRVHLYLSSGITYERIPTRHSYDYKYFDKKTTEAFSNYVQNIGVQITVAKTSYFRLCYTPFINKYELYHWGSLGFGFNIKKLAKQLFPTPIN